MPGSLGRVLLVKLVTWSYWLISLGDNCGSYSCLSSMRKEVWIGLRLNRAGVLSIKAATLASAGEGIDQTTAQGCVISKHLHPDAEESRSLGQGNHQLS
jgi:hypothetical protein